MIKKPKLGQNFLQDTQAIQRIVAALGPITGRTVVEIGPGRGAITRALAADAGKLIAIELDRELAEGLRAEFSAEHVAIVEQSVLDFDFSATSAKAGEKLIVAGNLPYYITSPILLKLASSHAALDCAVLMVQREVADRVTATPGSRDYGLLSVTVQLYGPAQQLFTLPPAAFNPPPEVHSTVFRWRFSPRFGELAVEPEGFLDFARTAFAQKRKTLANNLRAAGISPAAIAAAFAACGTAPQVRAEALGIEELASLWKALKTQEPLPV